MPELPEVETIVRELRQSVVGQRIASVEILCPVSVGTPAPEGFRAAVTGQRIIGATRRGKFIALRLERGDLLIHLRMTGRLLLVREGERREHRHLRLAFALEGSRLVFEDQRKFGRVSWVPDAECALATLGPEPLGSSFTPEALGARLCRRRGPIKSVLLDQRVLAGVGNIYADEALHTARIAPQRKACTLSPCEVAALHAAICRELRRGIRHRGTTLADYRDTRGRQGEHREHLRVYGRAGQPCLRCGALVVRDRIGGRSSYYCSRCQS